MEKATLGRLLLATAYLEGDFVFLKQTHVRKFQHYAALEYLKQDLFPGMYSLVTSKPSHINEKITQAIATKYLTDYYKQHGMKKYAKLSAEQIEEQKKLEEQQRQEKIRKRLEMVDEKIRDVNANILIQLI